MTRRSKNTWPLELRSTKRQPLIRSGGSSACDATNLMFAVRIADKVLERAPDFVGGNICISAHTRRGRDAENRGMLVIDMEKNRQQRSIKITFPTGHPPLDSHQPSEAHNSRPSRLNNIHATCWDEAWLIACEIGQIMSPKQVRLEYGYRKA